MSEKKVETMRIILQEKCTQNVPQTRNLKINRNEKVLKKLKFYRSQLMLNSEKELLPSKDLIRSLNGCLSHIITNAHERT